MKTTKSRIIIFAVALTYNLLPGFYLKDFLYFPYAVDVLFALDVANSVFANQCPI